MKLSNARMIGFDWMLERNGIFRRWDDIRESWRGLKFNICELENVRVAVTVDEELSNEQQMAIVSNRPEWLDVVIFAKILPFSGPGVAVVAAVIGTSTEVDPCVCAFATAAVSLSNGKHESEPEFYDIHIEGRGLYAVVAEFDWDTRSWYGESAPWQAE